MSAPATYVRARIDVETKDRAEAALEAMGLDMSTAIRMLLTRVGAEGKMPFAIKRPDATTKRAMAELDAGKGKRFAGVDELMADLHEAIERTGQFKKDFKRVSKTPAHKGFERLLVAVLEHLVADKPLPQANADHPLSGDWIRYRDCHIKPDLVLIYRQVDFVDARKRRQ